MMRSGSGVSKLFAWIQVKVNPLGQEQSFPPDVMGVKGRRIRPQNWLQRAVLLDLRVWAGQQGPASTTITPAPAVVPLPRATLHSSPTPHHPHCKWAKPVLLHCLNQSPALQRWLCNWVYWDVPIRCLEQPKRQAACGAAKGRWWLGPSRCRHGTS